MPRVARLDVPGLLQHIIVRGVERRENFMDDLDRRRFLDRLSGLLEETETRCYAWCLIPNHLLLLPTRLQLAVLMRRLLTGYAVTFNLVHQRELKRIPKTLCQCLVFLAPFLSTLKFRITYLLRRCEKIAVCAAARMDGRLGEALECGSSNVLGNPRFQ